MRINITDIDRKNFIVATHLFNNEYVYLVIPQHIGCDWNKDNLHFRSSVWSAEGELISASFPKFFNWGEHPEIQPLPTSLNDAVMPEKLDGSTLIVSKYKGNFMVRTRGTIDAHKMEKNGDEVDMLLAKYFQIQEYRKDLETWPFSMIFEWVSPKNQIVLNYPEAEIYLVGCVNHGNEVCAPYELWPQDLLDKLANVLFVPRPKYAKLPADTDEMIAEVESLQGMEGVVVYFNHGQSLLKLKSAWYLALHRMKSELSNVTGVMDYYFNISPDATMNYNDFYAHVCNVFDFELAEMCRGHISKIAESTKTVYKIVTAMKEFIEPLKILSRKDAAIKIIAAYGNTNRSQFAFALLDGKKLSSEQMKKLVYQCLPK